MTTSSLPVEKLYKRCAWNHHADCPGFFQTYSRCICDCHTPQAADARQQVAA